MSEREIKIIRNLEKKLKYLDNKILKSLRFRIFTNSIEDYCLYISYRKGKDYTGFMKSNCISYQQINASEIIRELKSNHYSVNGFVKKFGGYF